MLKGVDLSKNRGITSYQEVLSICKPLYELLEVTYFNYVKLFPNGARSVLTDRTDFITQYYSNPELFTTKAVLNMEGLTTDKVFLSCEFRDQLSYQIARNEFDIDNGLTIIQPVDDYLELYYFGTKKENYAHVETYKNNIDLFYRFIIFFKEQAKDLMDQADEDRFFLPGLSEDKPQSRLEDNIASIRQIFLAATKPSKIVTKDFNAYPVALTYREAEVMYYLSKFATAKAVANHLDISYRTVETHLSNIKEKLGYKKKGELLRSLQNSPLEKDLQYCFFE